MGLGGIHRLGCVCVTKVLNTEVDCFPAQPGSGSGDGEFSGHEDFDSTTKELFSKC